MRGRTILLAVLPVLAGCGDGLGPVEPIEELPRPLTFHEELLIDADTRFATKLFQAVVAGADASENVFISPLSAGMALGMTYNGAAGATRDAMQQALELQDMSIEQVNEAYRTLIELLRGLDRTVAFTLANSIWYRAGISVVPEFLEINRNFFDAEIAAIDFASPGAAHTINEWVERNTEGKITKIVDDPIDEEAIMFLINAIYFNGVWTHQFDKSLTKDADFHLENGATESVRMMSHKEKADVLYTAGDRFQAVDLPYGGQAFSMTILLPDEDWTVDSLIGELTDERLQTTVDDLHSRTIIVELPKFTLEFDLEMKDVLTTLGMGIAFSDLEADFTGLYSGPNRAHISTVKHKTFVRVDEEGTEAAAVTSVGVVATCACPPPTFRVDRPFVFLIRERFSNTILFVGRMMNPGSAS